MADLNRKGTFTFMQKGAAKVRKDVQGMSKDMAGVNKATMQANKAGGDQATTLKSKLIPSLGSLGKVLGVVGAAYGALTVARKAFDAAEHAAQIQNIETAFKSLTAEQDISARSMLASMKAATRGTVDEMSLMVQANQAAMLGLDLNQFDKMMEIARSASLATGQSMEFMLQSIVTGVGRQSKLILDNLGIVFDLESAYDRYAEQLGKTADKLTEVERKQAFTNAAMEAGIANAAKMGFEGTTAAEEFQRLKTATKDLGDSLSKFLVGPLSKAAGFVADIVEGINRGFEGPGTAGDYVIGPGGILIHKSAVGGELPTVEEFEKNRPAWMGESSFTGPGGTWQPGARTPEQIQEEAKATAEAAFKALNMETERLWKEANRSPFIPLDPVTPEQMDRLEAEMRTAAESAMQAEMEKSLKWGREFQESWDYMRDRWGMSWDEFQRYMADDLEATYGDSGEYTYIMEQWAEFMSTQLPEAVESGAERVARALQSIEFAYKGVADAFAAMIAGNKLALKEGLKVIAAEASARLKAIASQALIDAAVYTYQGIAAMAKGLTAWQASGFFAAAGKAMLVAGAAGVAAGTIDRQIAKASSSIPSGGGTVGGGELGTAAGGRESTNVTRTAPTTVNISIINNGPVYYGSEAHVTAQALQEVMDSGEVITPEQEVA